MSVGEGEVNVLCSNPWYHEDEHSTFMLFPLEPNLPVKRELEMLLYVH